MDNRTTDAVAKYLSILGISDLAEWDVMTFIYHHGTSLSSAEKIASMLGYSKASVGTALDSLTSDGLVYRSRNSHGARIYHLAAPMPDDARRSSLEELLKIVEERAGRLVLVKHLRKPAGGKDSRERLGLHLA